MRTPCDLNDIYHLKKHKGKYTTLLHELVVGNVFAQRKRKRIYFPPTAYTSLSGHEQLDMFTFSEIFFVLTPRHNAHFDTKTVYNTD